MIAAILAAAALNAAPPATSGDISRLAWMAGSWSETKDGATTRETWLAPIGGTMSGATQTNRPGKPATSEFGTITAGADRKIAFTPFMRNVEPTPFTLQAGPEGEAVFERVSDAFPKRVIYRKCGADLCARIEGVVKGDLKHQDWRYSRLKP